MEIHQLKHGFLGVLIAFVTFFHKKMLMFFHKIFLQNLTSYTNPCYTVDFKLPVLSVFPSISDASRHFHIETPSFT